MLAALEVASPPSHAFGRAATTGVGGGTAAEDREFDHLLAELGLEAYAAALRASVVVNVDELRELTEADLVDMVPGITVEERTRVLRWALGSS